MNQFLKRNGKLLLVDTMLIFIQFEKQAEKYHGN